jgi:ATP adenylyltransferase/5',5'''-P-1,P-4-tetraphosphate phosphorylase II
MEKKQLMENSFYSVSGNVAVETKKLLNEQKKSWPQCAEGYGFLDSLKIKTFQFDGFTIKVQFNYGRLISSSAKVDAASIKERKCFLCPANLPDEQKGIYYKNDFVILCNPFPIFKEHFTIPKLQHTPQRIVGNINSLLALAKDLGEYYSVFYNGPKCGASAPDHLHFQAGNKDFMPIDNEYETLKAKYGDNLVSAENIEVYSINDGLRKFISLESKDEFKLTKKLLKALDIISNVNPSDIETMINILVNYSDETGWRVIIFPREKHRPSHYFAEGEDNILLSPASVDVGGVCITPLEKDFNKIDEEILRQIFSEVMLNNEKFISICAKISNEL